MSANYLKSTLHMLGIVIFLLMLGCTSPYDYKVSPEPDKWKTDENLKAAMEKLPQEEKALLAKWMIRAAMSNVFGGETGETTIGKAIENQRTFEADRAIKEAEQKALAEKVEKEKAVAASKMNAVLTVALTRLEFFKERFLDGFKISLALENKSTKDLAGVKGSLFIRDMFDDKIKNINFSIDQAIPAGQTLVWEGTLDYNQFMAEDNKLKTTPLDKMKIFFEPEVFIFTDGSKMMAPK